MDLSKIQQQPIKITSRLHFYISVSCGILLLIVVFFIFIAWSTKHTLNGGARLPEYFSACLLKAADIPIRVKDVFKIIRESNNPKGKDNPYHAIDYSATNINNLRGGLLVSRIKSNGENEVLLINLSSKYQKKIYNPKGVIAVDSYSDKVSDSETYRESSLSSGSRIWHPHISSELKLVYTIPGNDLIAIDLKNNHEVWRVYGAFHHSIEQDSDGNYWVCASVDSRPKSLKTLGEFGNGNLYQDNCIIKISQSGKILLKISITKILIKNGLEHLLFGASNPDRNNDPIHLNQVSPILKDDGLLRKGQLLVSLRNLSTLLLVDPQNESIVWSKTGPWMNQHCVLPFSKSTISILDNHSFGSGQYWLMPTWQTRIISHNIESGETQNIVDQIAPNTGLRIGIEGRALPFQKNGWIVEDSVFGTIFVLIENKIVFKWQNTYPGGEVGAVSWCRYVDENMLVDLEGSIKAPKVWQ